MRITAVRAVLPACKRTRAEAVLLLTVALLRVVSRPAGPKERRVPHFPLRPVLHHP
jgi:hypothetical protein